MNDLRRGTVSRTTKNKMTNEQIACVCHQANKAYCEAIGDNSQPDWTAAPDWQKESAIKGVAFTVENPDAPDSAQHEAWCADKVAGGWQYGPEKDSEKKTHPCIIPYDQLPVEQRRKDALFRGVVKAMMME